MIWSAAAGRRFGTLRLDAAFLRRDLLTQEAATGRSLTKRCQASALQTVGTQWAVSGQCETRSHESKARFFERCCNCDPRRQGSRHSSRHKATPYHRHLGGRGRESRFRALVESEASELVPCVSGRTPRRRSSRGSRASRARSFYEKRALEDGGRSRVPAEIQYAGLTPFCAGLRSQEATRHHNGTGAGGTVSRKQEAVSSKIQQSAISNQIQLRRLDFSL